MFDKKSFYDKLVEKFPGINIKIDELMKKHTSFQIGGPADILILPKNKDELKAVLVECSKDNITPYIIGNGTNLLVMDNGVRGVIIKIGNNFNNIEVCGNVIVAHAGVALVTLSYLAMERGLTGLEFAGGIPGSVGGAVYMNAGAYGGEMRDVVTSAEVMNFNGDEVILDNSELQFGYRKSLLQNGNLIATKIKIQLKEGNYEEIRKRMDELNHIRKKKQPLVLPSAGSTFKRPDGYYAGELIEKAGLKGFRVRDAQVSELHAGFIVNLGEATAKDVIELINCIKKKIKEQYNVELVPEVKILGEE